MVPWVAILFFGFFIAMLWQIERRQEREERKQERMEQREAADREFERARQLAVEEAERHDNQRSQERWRRAYEKEKEEKSRMVREAGGGTGGYIVIDLEDEHRRLFQDLLKGFEEYAMLQGYEVAFSADSTYANRIAFKFTVISENIIVGSDRVRNDLKEYLEKINSGDSLDDIPVVILKEEHDLLLTTLKNRLSFLQHSYNLERNAREFYEKMVQSIKNISPLPSQNIVLQTGGALTNSTYSAINSPQALLGSDNTAKNLYIGSSLTELQEQADALDTLLLHLNKDSGIVNSEEIYRLLQNTKEEIELTGEPDRTRISSWLEKSKQALQAASLGHDTVEAAKKLFTLFGLGW